MLPVFRPGQVVPVLPGPLRPGDCAVYLYGGRSLLHRVCAVGAEGATFTDDAGRLEPHLVRWAAISGRAHGGFFSGGLPGRVYSLLRRSLSALLPRA